jgi:hypothetical protein
MFGSSGDRPARAGRGDFNRRGQLKSSGGPVAN